MLPWNFCPNSDFVPLSCLLLPTATVEKLRPKLFLTAGSLPNRDPNHNVQSAATTKSGTLTLQKKCRIVVAVKLLVLAETYGSATP
jgi:hypothetical protein